MTRTLARPYPLGATLGNTGCNFSIYSPDCKSLSLALFDENDEFVTYKLGNEYADIRYVFVEGIKQDKNTVSLLKLMKARSCFQTLTLSNQRTTRLRHAI